MISGLGRGKCKINLEHLIVPESRELPPNMEHEAKDHEANLKEPPIINVERLHQKKIKYEILTQR